MTSSVTDLIKELNRRIRRLFIFLLLATIACYLVIPLDFSKPIAELSQQFNLGLVSPFVPSTIALFLLGYWMVAQQFSKLLQRKLSHVQQLELWAGGDDEQVKRWSERAVEQQSLLVRKIISLLHALQQAEQGDSQFEQRLRQRALLDAETGIGNRAYFSSRLDALLCEPDVHGAVLLIHFNEAAFSSEHQVQVEPLTLLQSAIQGIQQRLVKVPNYFLARQSEFELALLLSDSYPEEAQKLAGKLLLVLQNMAVLNNLKMEELVHIGLSCFDQQPAYQIMAEADMALRTAQLQGPSQWFMLDSNEIAQANIKGSLQWRTLLQWAIEQHRIDTFFQPVIARDASSILHFETFAKLKDKQGQCIRAGLFLPMAQKCGLASQIDLVVFQQVWQKLVTKPLQPHLYSVNLSVEFLLCPVSRQQILHHLNAQPESAKRLIIEVSEYHLANHLAECLAFFQSIHAFGVQLLVDKVGQYVVNAGYLKTGLISALKLHPSIVLNIPKKAENQVFIQSIKTLSEAQKVMVFALGVETFDEWQTLLRLGIDGGQGHYFTKPTAQISINV